MMKFFIVNIFLMLSLNSHGQTKITSEDLKIVIGNWEGSITYLDYQSNKPYSMPVNLIVKQGKNENTLSLTNIYPNEPKANSSDNIKIGSNGMLLNRNMVTSRVEIENGGIQIQTEHVAKDDRKKAVIRYTYIIGSDIFIIRKEVKFEQAEDWIKRSEYKYQRKK